MDNNVNQINENNVKQTNNVAIVGFILSFFCCYSRFDSFYNWINEI